MSRPNNQSIIGKALFKGTLMALTNACIIWLILYIANMDKSVLMVVAVVVAAAFGYVTAYLEARAALNAQEAQARHARGGDVSSSSSDGVDTSDSSDSSREEDDKDDFVDPGPDPYAGDFDSGSSSSDYSSSDFGGGDSGGGDSGGGDSGGGD